MTKTKNFEKMAKKLLKQGGKYVKNVDDNLFHSLLLERGWIVKKEKNQLKVTKKGLRGLDALCIDTKNIIELL